MFATVTYDSNGLGSLKRKRLPVILQEDSGCGANFPDETRRMKLCISQFIFNSEEIFTWHDLPVH